jgi:hypothetical protein
MTSTTTQPKKSQPTYQPIRKVTVGAFTGALVTLTVLILNDFVIKEGNQKISGELTGAATTVLTFIVSYLVPPGMKETVVLEDSVTKSAQE